MKKLKRIDLKKNFIEDGRICYHNHQRFILARGINDIMYYLEKLNKKVDRIEREINKENCNEQRGQKEI